MWAFARNNRVGPQIIEPQGSNAVGEGTPNKQQMEPANFLKVFFTFTYYLGVSPYRFVMEPMNGTPAFSKIFYRPQQVLCALLHFLCVVCLVADIREKIPGDWTASRIFKNPAQYFDIALVGCTLFYKLATIKRLWLNTEEYVNVLNFFMEDNYLPLTNKWITKVGLLYAVYAFSAFKGLACLVTACNLGVHTQSWSPSLWLRHVWGHGKFVFCFSPLDTKIDPPELEDFTGWDGALVGITVATLYIRYIILEFCDLMILACVLTLWTPVNSFSNEIDDIVNSKVGTIEQTENEGLPQGTVTINIEEIDPTSNAHPCTSTWPSIYRSFKSIHKLSNLINKTLGSQVSWYLAESVFFHSISFHTILLTSDEYVRFYKFAFYVLTFVILYMAADICRKLENLSMWLYTDDNIKSAPPDEANLVLYEMLTKGIGIRGSDAFTVTYPLVAGLLSVIITFFIICVQENDSPDGQFVNSFQSLQNGSMAEYVLHVT